MGVYQDYLDAHPICEMCGRKEARYVSMHGKRMSLCFKCGESYRRQHHAIIEPMRADSMDTRQDREMEDAEMENEVEDALRKLQEHEANAYLGNDRQDETANEDESVEDALQRLKTYEANAYLQEG